MAASVFAHPDMSAGIALLWAWTRSVFETSAYDLSALGFSAMSEAGELVTLANAVAYLLIGTLFWWKGIVAYGRAYRVLATAALSLGCALCMGASAALPALEGPSLSVAHAACMAGAALIGAGSACFYVELGRILGRLGPREALAHTAAGVLGAAAILALLGLLPAPLASVFIVLAPPLVMRVWTRWLSISPERLRAHGLRTESHVPWRLIVTAALVGAAFGVAFRTPLLGNYLASPLERNALTLCVASIVLAVSGSCLRMDFNQLIYRMGMPLLSAGFVVFATIHVLPQAGGFLFSVGYQTLDLLFWVLVACIISRQGVSANWIVTLTTGALILGRALGGFLYTLFSLLSPATLSSDLAIVMVFALLLNALVTMNARNMRTGWGTVRPAIHNARGDSIEAACGRLRETCGLTPRETEICALLAKGKSRGTISSELTVAEETVRTHASNIFRKLGVHSHQELIALVEQVVADLAEDRGDDGDDEG